MDNNTYVGDNNPCIGLTNTYVEDNNSSIGLTNTYIGDNNSYVGFTNSYGVTIIYVGDNMSYIGIGLGGSVGCAIRLETRRSWVQPLSRLATFFRGD